MNGRTNVTSGGSGGSLGGIIPLEAPSNFVVVADNAKCLLTWTDPKDKYADELGEITDEGDQLVSKFAYTRIVRKTTGYPSSPDDGDIVTESSTRNQYQSTAYSDEGLINNTLYYYAAFTCNTDGVWSGSVTGNATPKAYDPILANNTWEQINEVANEGIAASVWSIGDECQLPVNRENQTVVIIGFNICDKTDGSGKAVITFSLKNFLGTSGIDYGAYSGLVWTEGTYYSYLINNIPSMIPSNIYQYFKTINLHCGIGDSRRYDVSAGDWRDRLYTAKIFALTTKELFGYGEYGNYEYGLVGYDQYPYYTTTVNRVKKYNNGIGSTGEYPTTDLFSFISSKVEFKLFIVNTTGDITYMTANDIRKTGVTFNFCI